MKIFCVGRNYSEHAKELGNSVPTEPIIFMKPETAMLRNNSPFYYPSFSKDIHFEGEIVLRIGKEGKNIDPKFVSKYIESIGLGIDFTARDLQLKLKDKGLPWEIAKGFNGSAPVSEFIPASEFKDLQNITFSLKQNGIVKQNSSSSEMIFDFAQIIAYISTYFTFKKGDLIFTGTPSGVGPVQIGDKLELFLGEKKMLETEIK